jgi:L-arabinose isomerase
LHGLNQLPGLAVQNLMVEGFGFGAEGDWKTSAFLAILKYASQGKKGATAFMEDYTYDLSKGKELVLGAHMLEVDPSLAVTKPIIEVHPLGIGGKNDPARLVFDSILGDAIMISVIDTGYGFKAIIQKGQLVTPPEKMPKLPVAQVMWKLLPNFKQATQTWIEEGGAHHTILTTQFTAEDIVDLANIYGIESVVIG